LDGLKLVGIIVVSFFLIVGGLLLLLGTVCAFNGYGSIRPSISAGLVWTFFLALFLVLGVMAIASLAKGIRTSEMTSLNLARSGEQGHKASSERLEHPASDKEHSSDESL
jgi:hypothetical protein